MDLKKYYYSLSTDQQKAFAKEAGTDPEYIRVHLIPKNGSPDRIPRRDLFNGLVRAAGGDVSPDKVMSHFYGESA